MKRTLTPEMIEQMRQEIYETLTEPTTTHEQKVTYLARKAENFLTVLDEPEGLDELTSLAGVGRKTANVIRGNIFHEPSVVVDTHVKRISAKLGFTREEDPVKIEYDLMKVLPKDHWILYNIQIITFGREICFARNPKCEECFLTKYCSYYKERQKKK